MQENWQRRAPRWAPHRRQRRPLSRPRRRRRGQRPHDGHCASIPSTVEVSGNVQTAAGCAVDVTVKDRAMTETTCSVCGEQAQIETHAHGMQGMGLGQCEVLLFCARCFERYRRHRAVDHAARGLRTLTFHSPLEPGSWLKQHGRLWVPCSCDVCRAIPPTATVQRLEAERMRHERFDELWGNDAEGPCLCGLCQHRAKETRAAP
jgi:hypothetical protein